MKASFTSAVLLIASYIGICGAAEYYRPFTQIISTYNIPFKPIYATWAGILGVAALIIHQREEAPIAKER